MPLLFINQPNFTVMWTPSRVFLKDAWEKNCNCCIGRSIENLFKVKPHTWTGI